MPLPPEDSDEFAAWLMANAELHICNWDDLIRHLEAETMLDEFLAQYRPSGAFSPAQLKIIEQMEREEDA